MSDRRLRNLAAMGKSPQHVADLLGHTVEEILGKARELNVKWDPRWLAVPKEES